MPRPALDHARPGRQRDLRVVVELQAKLALDTDRVVDGVRRVHSVVAVLERVQQTGKLGGDVAPDNLGIRGRTRLLHVVYRVIAR